MLMMKTKEAMIKREKATTITPMVIDEEAENDEEYSSQSITSFGLFYTPRFN